METTDLETINSIKHQATNLRFRFETASRGCITISGVCWEALAADIKLSDTQRFMLDNIRFELNQLEEKAAELSQAVEHVFEAANRFDREVNK